MQKIFSNALSEAVSQTYKAVGIKTRNVVVADAADHALWHDLPVAAGGLCGLKAFIPHAFRG
jgi:hypothetical protein